MKRSTLRNIVVALTLALTLLALPAYAGAAGKKATVYKTTIKNGVLKATAPFQAFGNLQVGDCQYETAANLILTRWPKAKITTAQVVGAFNTYGDAWDTDGILNASGGDTGAGLWAGQNYLLTTGFAGHKAASITPLTYSAGTITEAAGVAQATDLSGMASVIAAANSGGVEVTVMGPAMDHVFAIVQATKTTLTAIDDGFVYHYTWAWLLYAYNPTGAAQITFYAVKW